MKLPTKSKLISKVLPPALRLWLKSQVEAVEELEINIQGGDRQIIGGYIPMVSLASSRAVYQGINLRQIQITGENIRINLSQVIRGKPLKLLEPLPVRGNILLLESDLQASLKSPLLTSGLTELFLTLLKQSNITSFSSLIPVYQLDWQTISLGNGKFTLTGVMEEEAGDKYDFTIASTLSLIEQQKLLLTPYLEINGVSQTHQEHLEPLEIDLGDHVELSHLSLYSEQLSAQGKIVIVD